MNRSDYCGNINEKYTGKRVVLFGWVKRTRDLGNLVFIQLRDREGVVQLSVNTDTTPEDVMEKVRGLKSEYVIRAEGTVRERTEGNINPDMKTGKVEVVLEDLEILNRSELPPFHIEDDINVSENLRLKYRYLDLRRPFMTEVIRFRYRLIDRIRRFMGEKGFYEIETPFLIKSTPEGARDFIVPSRLHKGKFYALPQSPQLFKQLLMVSGFDKYFQIARCFRDEDARSDRQTDFTQLDLEMSFVEQADILKLTEELMKILFEEFSQVLLHTPFDRLTYDECVEKYGTDKPDRRADMHLNDISSLFRDSEFKVFRSALENDGVIKCIVLEGKAADISRKKVEEFEKTAKKHGAKGLAWAKYEGGDFSGGVAKFLKPVSQSLCDLLSLETGDVLFFGADTRKIVNSALGALRVHLIKEFELADKDRFDIFWVTRFPMFEKDDKGDYIAMHHLFSMPTEDTIDYLDTEPEKVYGQLFDLVINGNEIASGSIRVHDEKLQRKIIKITGMSDEEITRKFGFLMDAFRYGAPPHGGVAPGIDRLVMLMKGYDNLKDVIAFPKTNNQLCLLTGAPDFPDDDQMGELGLITEVEE